MELLLDRRWKKEKYTIGNLYVNGSKFCNTIEDTDRGLDASMSSYDISSRKVYGETAIPTGTYYISMKVVSPKYSQRSAFNFTGGYMPRLLNVPGFDGILIHTGNTQYDSYGCIIVGKNTQVGKVTESMVTFRKLYQILKDASSRNETIKITIK